MKKNKMMRVASALLVAVLLTTSVISGTYAKYTTAEEAGDTARVAKWGVGITTSGTLFAEQYKDAPIANASDDSITVQVANHADATTDNVVAPGTKNEDGITFTLTGTPEVDLALTIAVETKDIVLPKKDGYTDYTDGNKVDTFDLANDYHPVVFTLTNGAGGTLATGTIEAIKTYLEGLTRAKIDSNTNLDTYFVGTDGTTKTDGTYKLTWEWAFEQNNKADTYIGNVIAGTVTDATCKTDISFDITITADQIN
ncbi:MAG: hypothetical protein IJN34_07990 [Clostridia bacterium]|nr:hypothetical protein [Clostridia bacterium]